MATNAPSTVRARRLRERRSRGVAMVAPVEVGEGGVALSCHAFDAASVARSGSICRSRLRQPRPARPWPRPVSSAHGAFLPGSWMVHS